MILSITNNPNPSNNKSIIYYQNLLKLEISLMRKPTETIVIKVYKILEEQTSIVANKRNKNSGKVKKNKSISSKTKSTKESTTLNKITSITSITQIR